MAFQYDQDFVPPVWPTQPNQQQMMTHLDLSVPTRNDLREAADTAVKLGATMADTQYGGDWITLIDPAGHLFCFVFYN